MKCCCIFVSSINKNKFSTMTTQDIYTALTYPANVQQKGNGPKLFDAYKYIHSKYGANARLVCTAEKIEVVDVATYKQIRREKQTKCVLVDTGADWSDIYTEEVK